MTRQTAPTAPPPSQLYLTVEEACLALRISRPTLYNEIRAGRLRSVQVGSRRFFRPAELERYAEAQEAK